MPKIVLRPLHPTGDTEKPTWGPTVIILDCPIPTDIVKVEGRGLGQVWDERHNPRLGAEMLKERSEGHSRNLTEPGISAK